MMATRESRRESELATARAAAEAAREKLAPLQAEVERRKLEAESLAGQNEALGQESKAWQVCTMYCALGFGP